MPAEIPTQILNKFPINYPDMIQGLRFEAQTLNFL